MELIKAVFSMFTLTILTSLYMQSFMGLVIGRGGENIKKVYEETGAKVIYDPSTRLFRIRGDDESKCKVAVKMVNELIEKVKKSHVYRNKLNEASKAKDEWEKFYEKNNVPDSDGFLPTKEELRKQFKHEMEQNKIRQSLSKKKFSEPPSKEETKLFPSNEESMFFKPKNDPSESKKPKGAWGSKSSSIREAAAPTEMTELTSPKKDTSTKVFMLTSLSKISETVVRPDDFSMKKSSSPTKVIEEKIEEKIVEEEWETDAEEWETSAGNWEPCPTQDNEWEQEEW